MTIDAIEATRRLHNGNNASEFQSYNPFHNIKKKSYLHLQ